MADAAWKEFENNRVLMQVGDVGVDLRKTIGIIQGRPEATVVARMVANGVMKPLRARWRAENKGWCFEPFKRHQERSWWRVAVYADNLWLWASSAKQLRDMMHETVEAFAKEGLVIGTIEVVANAAWNSDAAEINGTKIEHRRVLSVLGTLVNAQGAWDRHAWLQNAWRKRWKAASLFKGCGGLVEQLRVLRVSWGSSCWASVSALNFGGQTC